MQVLRVAITGQAGGPDLMEVIALLGPEEIATRINTAIQKISSED
jgi:glutamyl-tRNA synthetase